MKKRKSIIIVGAGISGMATGCYAQMNGYQSKIYEMHFLPGGSCTAWKRKNYVFDPCIEWMWGTGSHTISNKIWRELGAFKEKKIKNFDVFNQVRGTNGEIVNFHLNVESLEKHLKEISPEDDQPIEEFCNGLRSFEQIDFDLPLLTPMKLMGFFEKLRFIKSLYPYFKLFGDAEDTKLSEFVKRFKSPFLQQAFKYIFFQDHEIFPLFPYYTNLGAALKMNAGFPENGSLGVAHSIEKRYESLGGKIFYERKIKKILIKNDNAIGVEFEDGTQDFADIIVTACDGKSVIYKMLDGKYQTKEITQLYSDHLKEPIIYNGVNQIFFGVKDALKGKPHSVTYMLTDDEAKKIPALFDNTIVLQQRSDYCDSFAPDGHGVLFCCYLTDYDYWKNLYKNQDAYKKEKEKVVEGVLSFLEKHYSKLRENIEVYDVSTPVTVERYTGNHRGSIMAWKPFTKAEKLGEKFINRGMKLPKLKNFYMTGQWTLVGGLIRASSLGRYVMQFICKDDRKRFVTSEC